MKVPRIVTLNSNKQALIAINIAAVIFGTAALFGKLDISVFWIVGARGFFAAFSLALLAGYQREVSPGEGLKRCLKNGRLIVVTGVLLAVHWFSFFASVQIGGIPIATLTFASFPLMTMIIAVVAKRERFRLGAFVAGLAIVFAVLIVVDIDSLFLAKSSEELMGAGLGLLSAVSFSFFSLDSQKLVRRLSPVLTSMMQNFVVAMCALPFLPFAAHASASLKTWLSLLVLGVVTTALMHQLFLFALARLSAATCGAFVALEPVYAILLAALIFHQAIGWRVIVSALLIVSSGVVIMRELRPE